MKWAEDQGVRVEITSVTRTWAEQDKLYRNYVQCQTTGKAMPGMSCAYPANPPGASAHNYGFAWDSVVPDELMPWWVAVREAFGWRVPPNDLIHAELPAWEQYADPKLLM